MSRDRLLRQTGGVELSRNDLLPLYDAHLRTEAEMHDADRCHTIGPLFVGIFGTEGFITHADLADWPDGTPAQWVAAATEYFAGEPEIVEVEWKTRLHDRSAEALATALGAAGWQQQETETVMIGPAEPLVVDVALPDGVELVRVDAGEEPHVERWQARHGEEVITTGRIAFAPNGDFAGLWGAATEPEWRGRGIYRALTARRARIALDRGARYLYADCTDMSRPILERSGLTPITRTAPWLWTRRSAT